MFNVFLVPYDRNGLQDIKIILSLSWKKVHKNFDKTESFCTCACFFSLHNKESLAELQATSGDWVYCINTKELKSISICVLQMNISGALKTLSA